jgi:hypothetical protein
MTDPEIAHLELDLERGVEPITGQLRTDHTPARPFAGMLELIALLDRERASQADEWSLGQTGPRSEL